MTCEAAGQLTAAVPPRPDDRPLVVGTAVAEVFCRGTFVVSSAAPDSARVDNRQGKVELVRAAAPKRLLVPESGNGDGHLGEDRLTAMSRPKRAARPLGPLLRRRLVGIACTLMCRDFAGIASLTLASIYLQKAHGFGLPASPETVYRAITGARAG